MSRIRARTGHSAASVPGSGVGILPQATGNPKVLRTGLDQPGSGLVREGRTFKAFGRRDSVSFTAWRHFATAQAGLTTLMLIGDR